MNLLKGKRGRSCSQGSDAGAIATTRNLTRIICILKEFKRPMNYTEIRRYTGITTKLADGLRFLENHKIIYTKKPAGKSKVYQIGDSGTKPVVQQRLKGGKK